MGKKEKEKPRQNIAKSSFSRIRALHFNILRLKILNLVLGFGLQVRAGNLVQQPGHASGERNLPRPNLCQPYDVREGMLWSERKGETGQSMVGDGAWEDIGEWVDKGRWITE